MRRTALVISILVVGLGLSSSRAVAQEAAPLMPEDPRAPRFHEVEQGFFTGLEAGYLTFFKTPLADTTKTYAPADGGASSGLMVGANVGYEFNRRLALSLFFLGGNSSASASYGSFSTYVGGVDARVSLFGRRDANDVERLRLYVHARGGYLVTRPKGLFGDTDKYFSGGPGVEYDTRLRHFSVGLAADVIYVADAAVTGLAITPTVRYTF